MHIASVAYSVVDSDPRIKRQCESLLRAGHHVVSISVASAGGPRVGRVGRIPTIRVLRGKYRGSSVLRYGWSYLQFWAAAAIVLVRLRTKGALDVVQTSNMPNALGLLVLLLGPMGVRWIHDIHDPEPELFVTKFGTGPLGAVGSGLLRIIERIVAELSDLVIFAYEPTDSMIQRLGSAFTKVRYVPNLPDGHVFHKVPPHPRSGARAVFHGTVTARAGLDTVIRALGQLRRRGGQGYLDIIGTGDAVDALRAIVASEGLEGAVSIGGKAIPLDKLPSLLDGYAVGIAPMRRDEFMDCALPTKLLEYVRLGIPAIATETPTLLRHFPHDALVMVPNQDVSAWADALAVAFEQSPMTMSVATRAQGLPVARSWQDIEQQYVDVCGALR